MKRIWFVLLAATVMLLACACDGQDSSGGSGNRSVDSTARFTEATSYDGVTESNSQAAQASSAYTSRNTTSKAAATQKTLSEEEQKKLKEEMDNIIDELMGAD